MQKTAFISYKIVVILRVYHENVIINLSINYDLINQWYSIHK